MDSISNKAFAAGYFGGGILLVAHLGLLIDVRWLNGQCRHLLWQPQEFGG